MNGQFRNIIATIAKALPYNMVSINIKPAVIGLYHTIENEQPWYIADYHVKTARQFRKDIEFLTKKFRPVDLHEITNERNRNKHLIHFTFDDGLMSNYTMVAPILKEMGVPATFFINPGFLSDKDIFHKFLYEFALSHIKNLPKTFKTYPGKKELIRLLELKGINHSQITEKTRIYMNEAEVKDLVNMGFTIGGHSMDHPEFYLLTEQEQYDQVKNSMSEIHKKFKPHLKTFAFPYTDYGVSEKLMHRIFDEKIVDFTFGTAGLKYDTQPKHFQRIPFEKASNTSAKSIMKYEFFYFRLRKLINKNKVTRK